MLPDDKLLIYNNSLYTKNGIVVDYDKILMHDNTIIVKTTQIPSDISSYTMSLPQNLNTYQRWIFRLYIAPAQGYSFGNKTININAGAVKVSAHNQNSYRGMTTWLTVWRFDNLLYYLICSNSGEVSGNIAPLYNHTYISVSCNYDTQHVGTFEATFGVF